MERNLERGTPKQEVFSNRKEQNILVLKRRGTLSLRKPVPAILAFISHFRLKQLDLRNDQVHVDRLAAVL